jgi:hypothetical protein
MINDAGKQPVNGAATAFPFWKAFRSMLIALPTQNRCPLFLGALE